MAAEYLWNDEPDMLALLEDAAVLPTLSGFEPPAFAADQPLDVFAALPPTDFTVPPSGAVAPALDSFTVVAPPLQSLPTASTLPAPVDDVCKKETDILAHLLRSAPSPPSSPSPSPTLSPAPTTPSRAAVDSDAEDSVEGEVSSERDTSPTNAGASDSSLDGAQVGTSLSSASSDVTTGASAVERAKKAAEDFANGKVSERKRRLKEERDATPGSKRRKGNDGSSCSDGEDDAPEKVSHRKYQKRLQKNRDSAYVSRIRRREYTKRLEESLDRVEKEKNDIQSRCDALQRKFDLVLTELNALKDATARRFKSLAGPVGAAAAARTSKPKGAGTIVTTMFMCALMFGFCVPESITSRAPWAAADGPTSGLGPTFNYPAHNSKYRYSPATTRGPDKGRVWGAIGPLPPPHHWGVNGGASDNDVLLKSFSHNMTQLFGKKDSGMVTSVVERRLRKGAISQNDLQEIANGAKRLAQCDKNHPVRSAMQSRRSLMLRKLLRKAIALADECITKELVALLTIRLIPVNNVKAGL